MRAEGMSPLLALGLLVAGLCSSVHCLPGGGLDPEDVTPEDQHKGAPVDDHTFVSSNTDFAFSLYKQLALKTSNENVIFSPLSVSMALAFLSLGARAPTLTETLEGLKFNLTETPETEVHQGFQHLVQTLGRPSDQLQLSLGNAVFVQEQLKLLDKFREDARALCASEAFSTDFWDSDTAKKLINGYVRNKTQGKIVELFKDLDKLTEMMLVKYIFSKCGWKPFDPSHTYKSEFHVNGNRTVEVPMMTTGAACTAVELRYTGDGSAPFILPDEGKTHDLEAKVLLLISVTFYSLGSQMVFVPRLLHHRKPPPEEDSFLPGYHQNLEEHGDLTRISRHRSLKVGEVKGAALKMDEEGTEGAAGSGAQTLPVETPFKVKINKRFLLMLRENGMNNLLFLGKTVNPSGI
uniref:Serpin domain-containing protein n=1 Tax=Phocoena sinus TaxID=42100 RepID=A0A8C9B351_PHOSS